MSGPLPHRPNQSRCEGNHLPLPIVRFKNRWGLYLYCPICLHGVHSVRSTLPLPSYDLINGCGSCVKLIKLQFWQWSATGSWHLVEFINENVKATCLWLTWLWWNLYQGTACVFKEEIDRFLQCCVTWQAFLFQKCEFKGKF